MARTFDSVNDQISFSIGGVGALASSSWAMIYKRAADGAQDTLSGILTSGGSQFWTPYLTSGNTIDLWNGFANSSSGISALAAHGWVCLVVTKATGSSAPNFYYYRYDTDAWSTASGAALANSNGIHTSMTIGGASPLDSNFAGIDIEAMAVWNSTLTQAQAQSLPFSLLPWFEVQPAGLWIFDQGATSMNVPDLSGGGANQSGITDTAVATSSVPVFNLSHPTMRVSRAAAATTRSLAFDQRVGKSTLLRR